MVGETTVGRAGDWLGDDRWLGKRWQPRNVFASKVYEIYNRVMVGKGGYWTFGSRWLIGQMMVGRRGDVLLGR